MHDRISNYFTRMLNAHLIGWPSKKSWRHVHMNHRTRGSVDALIYQSITLKRALRKNSFTKPWIFVTFLQGVQWQGTQPLYWWKKRTRKLDEVCQLCQTWWRAEPCVSSRWRPDILRVLSGYFDGWRAAGLVRWLLFPDHGDSRRTQNWCLKEWNSTKGVDRYVKQRCGGY